MASLAVMDLDHWCDRIIEAKASFRSISFQHIYREHNSNADGLSKEALSIELGKFSFIKFLEGEAIGNGNLQLF